MIFDSPGPKVCRETACRPREAQEDHPRPQAEKQAQEEACCSLHLGESTETRANHEERRRARRTPLA